MIRRRGCLALLLVAAVLGGGGAAAIPGALRGLLEAPGTQTARVLRVVDGDTLVVRRSGPVERLRLLGVDAPEASSTRHGRAECGGHTASAATRSWVAWARRRVELRRDRLAPGRDRYGRLLAHVRSPDGGDLAGWLVGRGLARTASYENRPLAAHPRLLALEAKARARRAGLWSSCPGWAREHPIPFAAVARSGTAREAAEGPVELALVALPASPGPGR